MKPKTTTFENYDTSRLKYCRICKNDHCQPDGQNVRPKRGACLACLYELPPGPYEHTFVGIEAPKILRPKARTKEESRLAHIEQQKKWNKKNKEKVRGI